MSGTRNACRYQVLLFSADKLYHGHRRFRGDALTPEAPEARSSLSPNYVTLIPSPSTRPTRPRACRVPRTIAKRAPPGARTSYPAIALVTFADLRRGLGATYMEGHRGIAHQPLEERQVPFRPWSPGFVRPADRLSSLSPLHKNLHGRTAKNLRDRRRPSGGAENQTVLERSELAREGDDKS